MPEPRLSRPDRGQGRGAKPRRLPGLGTLGRRASRRRRRGQPRRARSRSPGATADVVSVRAFDDFAAQRNAALELATGDWVLAIDADERVTPELAAEIRRVDRRSAPSPSPAIACRSAA